MLGKVNLLPVDIAVVAHKQTSKCGKKTQLDSCFFATQTLSVVYKYT